jgi:hypothetical protein
MPTVSRSQQKLMHGIASGSIKPGNGKPSLKVAKDFAAADHARGAKKLPERVGHAIVAGKSARDL